MAALALGALVVPFAKADPHCDGEKGAIYLFSRWGSGNSSGGVPSGVPTLALKGVGCNVGEDPDLRYLHPLSNQVSVRYTQDLKVKVLKGHLKGLGLDKDIDLKRVLTTTNAALAPVTGEAYYMDSDFIDIDPTKTGELIVTVYLDTGPVSDTFKTVA